MLAARDYIRKSKMYFYNALQSEKATLDERCLVNQLTVIILLNNELFHLLLIK